MAEGDATSDLLKLVLSERLTTPIARARWRSRKQVF